MNDIKRPVKLNPASNPVPGIVVGIGASSGSSEAALEFLSSLRNGMSVSVVLILAECDNAKLSELSKRLNGFETAIAKNRMPVKRNYIYVAPKNADVTIKNGKLQVSKKNRCGAPLDKMLLSLASERGNKAIGILFSSDGSDGVLGLRDIANANGMTMMCESEALETEELPETAKPDRFVDHILPPAKLASEFNEYIEHLQTSQIVGKATQEEKQLKKALPRLCELLFERTGHDFQHYKSGTLMRRVQRRMQVVRSKNIAAYVHQVEKDQEETQALFKKLLIGVTEFFRDPNAFTALAREVLPKVFANVGIEDCVRIWVPGCSTGEEAYTIAMLCSDCMEQMEGGPPAVQIFATDIDDNALAVARRGVYSQGITEKLPAAYINKYFVKHQQHFQVANTIREMCLFSKHNLICDPPLERLDLISCRNLLIYLGLHLQEKLIPMFHQALCPDGYLFLGPGENLISHQALFEFISPKYRIAQRKPSAVTNESAFEEHETARANLPPTNSEGLEGADLHLISQKILLDEFAPKYAVVNEKQRIVYLSEGTGDYLEMAAGMYSNNIVRAARIGLRAGIRSALGEAQKTRRKVVRNNLSVHLSNGLQPITLTVQPMPQLGADMGLNMVIFQNAGPILNTHEAMADETADQSESIIAQLEKELARTRYDLEKFIQEVESANEALQLTNDQLHNVNEEYQAANEELELSKHQMLITAERLAKIKSDFDNLFNSTEIATIFIDNEMRLQFFTPPVVSIYNLLDQDIGRPLSHITHCVKSMPPLPTPAALEAGNGAVENEIETPNGKHYLRRVSVYRDKDRNRQGTVITFTDVTEIRESQHLAQLHLTEIESFYQSAPIGLCFLDSDLRFARINERLAQMIGMPAEAHIGKTIKEIVPMLAKQIEPIVREVITTGTPQENLETIWETLAQPGVERIWRSSFHRLLDASGAVAGVSVVTQDITESKQVNETLMLRDRAIAASSDSIVMADAMHPEMPLIYVNKAFEGATGYSAEDVIGLNCRLLQGPETDKEVVGEIRAAVKEERDCDVTLLNYRKDGSTFWNEVSISPVFNGEDQVTHFLSVQKDVSKRLEIEQSIRTSDERFRLLLNSTAEGIYGIDETGVCTFCNSACITLLGYESSDDLIGQNMHQLIHHSHDDGTPYNAEECPINQVVQTGTGVHTIKEIFWRADGMPLPVRCSSHPMNQSGTVIGAVVTFLDLTQRDLANEVIRRQAGLLALSRDAIIVWRSNEGIEYWNKGAEMLYGYTEEEAIGKLPVDLLQTVLPEDVSAVASKLDDKGRWDGEVVHYTKKGNPIPVSSRQEMERGPRGERLILEINRDISDRKQIEQSLLDAQRTAEAANNSKSQFLANMSHEVRSPMTAIMGYADLLTANIENANDLEYVNIIKRNGLYLLDIVNDILDLSKIEAGKLDLDVQRISPTELIAEVRSLMEVRAQEKNLPLRVEYASPIPELVDTDPVRLRQILINVLSNAIKFTEKGHVELIVNYEAESSPQLSFAVHDTGIGIAPDQMRKLFEPFSQADISHSRRYGGTGLGLSISKRLAEMLGGKISMKSEPGKGSTATLVLPLETLEGVAISVPRTDLFESNALVPGPRAALSSHILVVDDRQDIQNLARRILECAGARVGVANNGKSAIESITQAESAADAFDIIVIDMQMPVMDGYQAVRKLRRLGFDRPIIALTASAMAGEREKCIDAGCDDFLSKPVESERLIELVALHQREPEMVNLAPATSSNVTVAESKKSAPAKACRILIVDDSKDASSAMSKMLSLLRYEVLVAHDGQSAISCAHQSKPDVIISDIGLPDIDGYEIISQLRASGEFEQTVFVALSGGEADQARLVNAGFDHYLMKPASIQELIPLLPENGY